MMYEKVYTGLRYVTFVNGRSRGEIVEEMEALLFKQDARLTTEFHQQDHQWKAELKRGIADVFKIAHSRLSSITPAPNP
jgi:2-oxo-4-hydroxy-4-carboxy--5-ureidoimidazoline (OHCU) decarboxylase